MQGLQPLIAFAQTARRGSFAAAARDLGGTPSTVAKSVARLEASLGVRLFHRTTRQVTLTPDGERLFRRCERVLAELDDLQAEAAGTRATVGGTLRLDAPVTYGRKVLMPVLNALLRRHPELRLDLRLQDSYADLVRDGLDAAIRVGELQDSRLVARRFDAQHLLLVASPAYLAERGEPQRLDQLAGHAAIVFRLPSSGRQRPWQFRNGRQAVSLLPTPSVEINDGEGIVAAAVLGLGLAQVPDNMVVDAIARGELVELLPRHRPAAMPISVVLPTSRLQPPRVRVLLEALEAMPGRAAR
ncbi:LysR family transcriptional regulator [Roseateles sp.]|uniref:LysR family transcriptional regulator n=1 Tax=Roseateles sp. TaxID=1971397 RepID=UPI002E0B581E|nr:LysR family transcriptional regulator [Roseateles sp.]